MAERSQDCFNRGGTRLVTHIDDREADIYEEWAIVQQQLCLSQIAPSLDCKELAPLASKLWKSSKKCDRPKYDT